jgi:Ca-activated chloride channel family protein
MTTKNNCRFIILLLFIVSMSAAAQAQRTDGDKTLSPYFFVQGDPTVDRLPLKDTRVEISVSGVIADVHVTQTYRNEGDRPINARYVFPASTRAAVYSMRMKIRDQVIIAKIKEREAARTEFENAKKDGKSASLLEEDRPNVFSMNLANIMPTDDVEIDLRYTELLVPTDGVYEVVYPTVVGPRYSSESENSAKPEDKVVKTPYLHQAPSPTSALHITAKFSTGVPIRELHCTSHQIAAEQVSPSVARLTLDEADAFQGNRDFVVRYKLNGDQINSGLLLFQGTDENFFLYMAQPPERIDPAYLPPREYVFVVDVSGSMDGFPLNTAKQLLTQLIGNLRPSDYFNVVLFAGDSTVLSQEPLAANQENISRAIQLIDGQRGAGGTELLDAMTKAMSLSREPNASRSVVLITDGYVSGEKGVFDQIRKNLNQTNVFAFGIGTSVNRYLIEGVAHAGMGEPFVVENEDAAASTAAKFREYIESPVLTNIAVKSNGFDIYDVSPGTFPDMFARRPIILFGKWRGSAVGTIELTGKNANGDFASTINVADIQPDESNSALRYLWARDRIASLSDFGNGDASPDDVKAVTQLGLKYNLLTPYTSFIAVREKIVNPNGDAEDVDQALPLPEGVVDTAVGSEPELWWLAIASILAIALLGLRRRIFVIEAMCKRVDL